MGTFDKIIAAIFVVALLAAGAVAIIFPARRSSQPVATTTARTTTAPAATNSSSLTLAQVAEHNSATSCYSVINGSVYDLTSYVDSHPGGSNSILSICGQDGSSAFNSQHGGQGRPEQVLQQFKIGSLAG